MKLKFKIFIFFSFLLILSLTGVFRVKISYFYIFNFCPFNPLSPSGRCQRSITILVGVGLKGAIAPPFWTRGIKQIAEILKTDPKLEYWTTLVEKTQIFLQLFGFWRCYKRPKKVKFFYQPGVGSRKGL